MRRFAPLLCLLGSLWGRVDQNNDVQLWITQATTKDLGQKYSFYLANQWRFGNDISQLYFIYLESFLTFKWTDRTDLVPGYRQVWRQDGNQKWRLRYEPLIELIFHHANVFQIRHRISYLIREKETNSWDYRIRVRLSSDGWTINPYFFNEVFLRSEVGFRENRTAIGVSVPLFWWNTADLSCMLRFIKSQGVWTHQYVFGAWFNLSF